MNPFQIIWGLLFSSVLWCQVGYCTRNSMLEQELVFMCYWYKCPPHLSRKSWLCHLVTPCYLKQRDSCSHMKEMITSTSFCCVWDVVILLWLKSSFGTCFLQWNCCYIFPAQWSRMWSDILNLWSINFQIIESTVVFFSFLCAVFENKDKIVIIMEYASKGELYDYISERRRLSERETRHFFRQIVSAVHYCHKVSKGFHSKKCCFKADDWHIFQSMSEATTFIIKYQSIWFYQYNRRSSLKALHGTSAFF